MLSLLLGAEEDLDSKLLTRFGNHRDECKRLEGATSNPILLTKQGLSIASHKSEAINRQERQERTNTEELTTQQHATTRIKHGVSLPRILHVCSFTFQSLLSLKRDRRQRTCPTHITSLTHHSHHTHITQTRHCLCFNRLPALQTHQVGTDQGWNSLHGNQSLYASRKTYRHAQSVGPSHSTASILQR